MQMYVNVNLMEKNVIKIDDEITIKDYIWNLSTCSCENGKYLANIMDDSAITCDEIIAPHDEQTKAIPTTFNEKKATCKL